MKVSHFARLSCGTITAFLFLGFPVWASADLDSRLKHGIDLHIANHGSDSALAALRGVLHEAQALDHPDSVAMVKAVRELRNVFQSRGQLDSVDYYNSRTYSILLNLRPGQLEAAQNFCLEEARRLLGCGDKDRAKFFFNRAIAESLLIPPGATGDPRWACHNWGEYSYTIMKYQVAEKFFLRAIDEAVRMAGEYDWVTDEMVSRLGNFYNEMGRYPEALGLQWRDLNIRRHIYGEHSTKVAACLNNIAIVHKQRDMLDSAETLLSEALQICTASGDSTGKTTMTILGNFAETLERQGKYAEAESLYLTVLENRKDDLNRSLTALAQSELANFYRNIGRFRDATMMLEEALTIRKSLPTLQEHVIATNCADLARVYLEQADYVSAERLLRDATARHRSSVGANHPELANDLISLGKLLLIESRYVEAEAVLSEAQGLLKSIHSGPHTALADVLSDLAHVALAQGNYSLARERMEHSRQIRKQVLGENNPGYADALEDLANLQVSAGAIEEASKSADHCLRIRKSLLPGLDPGIAKCISLQARIDLKAGHFDRATHRYRKAIQSFRSIYGEIHPSLADASEGLSSALGKSGQNSEALAAAIEATTIRFRLFKQNAQVLSERSALAYVTALRNSCNLLLSTYFSNLNNEYQSEVAAIILQSKFLVTEEMKNLDRYDSQDTTAIRLREKLRLNRFRLAKLFVEGPKKTAITKYTRELDSLSKFAEELATRLSLLSKPQSEVELATLASLCHSIPESTLVVEYVKYTLDNEYVGSSSERYAALALQTSGLIQFSDLGDATALDELISEYQSHMNRISNQGFATKSDSEAFGVISRALSGYLLSPLSSNFGKFRDLILAPDGNISSVAFSALPHHGKYLVEHHNIRYVNTVRELKSVNTEISNTSCLLAIGDPDFDLASSESFASSSKDGAVTQGFRTRIRSNRSTCLAFDDLKLSRLPASSAEVNSIVTSWGESPTAIARVLSGTSATEEAFKALASNFNCIHIATHGFAIAPDCGSIAARLGTDKVHHDPLLLSGVYLAGANNAVQRSDFGLEDGILTASEIADLDLRRVNTVVLSSCESGLGALRDGEGVFGLTRAFRLAGVRTVISTLWKIPDEQTVELMAQVYDSRDNDFGSRISQIQRDLIKNAKNRGRTDHPFAWGSFIAVGDQ